LRVAQPSSVYEPRDPTSTIFDRALSAHRLLNAQGGTEFAAWLRHRSVFAARAAGTRHATMATTAKNSGAPRECQRTTSASVRARRTRFVDRRRPRYD
jgi:hypothetical protein